MLREIIIFSISLGVGGHIALGVVLHSPDLWSWEHSGTFALLIGFSVYVTVQLARSLWWVTASVTGRSARKSRDS